MTPEDEEFERIEREAKMKPPNISFNMTNPMPKAVMTLSCEGIWVDPSLSVNEAARVVLGAIDTQVKYMVAMAVQAEREACAKDKQDAERYRHMRNNAQFQSRNGPGLYWYLPRFFDGKVRDEGQQLDDAVDAAIRARSQP